MCALLVEILVPVASVIKFESSLPVVRKFISMLYGHSFDQAKKKHATSAVSVSICWHVCMCVRLCAKYGVCMCVRLCGKYGV